MKRVAVVLLAGACLAGCSTTSHVGGLADRTFFGGFFGDSHARKVNEAIYRADVKACGRWAASEWCRLAADDRNLARFYPGQAALKHPPGPSATAFVFDESQCRGAMIDDRCHGQIAAMPSVPPICHGTLIDDVCTGPTY